MRRIAYIFLGLALVGAATWFCSSDAPGPTLPKTGGGNGSNGTGALQIRLFTSNANPVAGTCTLIQAVVTLNGVNVPDGTGVAFTTNLSGSFFEQNGLALISVVTQGGTTTTALCSPAAGLATVRATSTIGSETGTATIQIAFQPSPQIAPFFTFCAPSFGVPEGGTTLTINGGRFFGDPTTTRATFTVNGITREALVTAVTATTVTLVTPAFPEATSPSVPVAITVTFGTKTATPVTLSLPNCFVFGTTGASNPSITAILPSSGSNEGNTRVTIIGSGFVAPVQVFFGVVEAQVLSVSFNQIIVLTPPASGAGLPNLNSTVDVRVHEINSGLDATLTGGFRFVTALQTTAIDNNRQSQSAPFTPVTIHGQGFLAPVAVSLAGIPATVISVSATELLVLPGARSECGDKTGDVVVTNIDSGDTSPGPGGIVLTFTYLCTPPTNTPLPTSTPLPTGTPTFTPTATPTRTPVPPDLELTQSTPSPNPVSASAAPPLNQVTFNLTVTNKGTINVSNVVVSDPLPDNMTFVSCNSSQGSCLGPAVGSKGTVTASLGAMTAPGIAQITIVATAVTPGTFQNIAVVTSSPQDPNPVHTISSATVTVNP
jgi:uncharacterized repeat protein (TIGR01451 family)